MEQIQNAVHSGDTRRARIQGKTDFSSGAQEGFFCRGERARSEETVSACGCAGSVPQGEPPNVCWHQHNTTDP